MASLLGRYRIGAFKASSAHSVAELLPWTLVLEDKRTVLLKDGAFMTCWSVRGPDMDAAPDYYFGKLCQDLAGYLNELQGGWTVFYEDARVRSAPYPDSAFTNQVAQLIDSERQQQFSGQRHYENRYYLTVTYLPPSETHSKIKRYFIEGGSTDTDSDMPALTDFRHQVAALDEALRYQLMEVAPLLGDALLTYLHSTISTQRFEIGSDDLPILLDRLLSDEDLVSGFYPRIGDHHLRVIGIKKLLGPTKPGLFQHLNALPYPYRMVARFIAVDDQQAQSEINRLGRFWYQRRSNILATTLSSFTGEPPRENPEALRRADEADEAALNVQERRASHGYCTLSIAIWDTDEAVVEQRAIEIAELVRRARSIPVIERVNAFEAWLGMVPGNSVANVRRPLLSTIHFSHMAPVAATWAGPDGVSHEQLQGPPHIICETSSTTPFRFSTYVGDVGHFLVIGPTGAGKSTLLNLLAAQWLRYSNDAGNAQVFVIDQKRSLRCLVRALGGTYHDLAKTDGTLTLQPLREVDRAADREWAASWLVRLFKASGLVPTPEQHQEIWSALSSMATQPPVHRTLSVLRNTLQSDELRQALMPYTIAGPAGRYLDADHTEDPDEIEAIDLADLLDTEYAAPILDALFHRFERRFDGRPTLLLVDEAWLPLMRGDFLERLRKWLKTLRSRNVAVGLSTQEAHDFLSSPVAQTILNSCPAHIFLPNPAVAREEVYKLYKSIGLNERQIHIVQDAQQKRDYLFVTPVGTRLVSFSLGPITRALCASTNDSDQHAMDTIPPSIHGARFAAEWLEQRGFSEAAALIRDPVAVAAE